MQYLFQILALVDRFDIEIRCAEPVTEGAVVDACALPVSCSTQHEFICVEIRMNY